MKSRNEMMHEYYMSLLEREEKGAASKPRYQTGPKASFMSWVGQLPQNSIDDRMASKERTERTHGEENDEVTEC